MTLSGVASAGCDCSAINGSYLLPNDSFGENGGEGGDNFICTGELGLGFGIGECGEFPIPGVLFWQVTCELDGSHTLLIRYTLGAITDFEATKNFPPGTDCLSMTLSTPQTGPPDSNCDFSGATLTASAF
ncbi:MAG: hypothetical protein AAF394_01420 [Planctomycetota bacterium]